MDPRGARGDRGEHDFGRRDREVLAMMFADAEEREPQTVGEHGFFNYVAQYFRLLKPATIRTHGDVSERIQTEFNRLCHVPPCVCSPPFSLQTTGRDRRLDSERRSLLNRVEISDDRVDSRRSRLFAQSFTRSSE